MIGQQTGFRQRRDRGSVGKRSASARRGCALRWLNGRAGQRRSVAQSCGISTALEKVTRERLICLVISALRWRGFSLRWTIQPLTRTYNRLGMRRFPSGSVRCRKAAPKGYPTSRCSPGWTGDWGHEDRRPARGG